MQEGRLLVRGQEGRITKLQGNQLGFMSTIIQHVMGEQNCEVSISSDYDDKDVLLWALVLSVQEQEKEMAISTTKIH